MELYEAIIYIIGTGLMGVLAGTILGVILGAEQIIRLRDENEKLRKEIGAIQEITRPKQKTPEVFSIDFTVDPANVPTFKD
jgi:threonine dehydrogenase-like Zn-dependent dehydrogenase